MDNQQCSESLTYGNKVKITYTNWKGETGDRTIKPIALWSGSTEYHPEEQWLLHAWDYEKQDFRQFAMKHIKNWADVTEVQCDRTAPTLQ